MPQYKLPKDQSSSYTSKIPFRGLPNAHLLPFKVFVDSFHSNPRRGTLWVMRPASLGRYTLHKMPLTGWLAGWLSGGLGELLPCKSSTGLAGRLVGEILAIAVISSAILCLLYLQREAKGGRETHRGHPVPTACCLVLHTLMSRAW